jgi:hypothetical protein
MLLFAAESYAFHLAILTYNNLDIHKCNLACLYGCETWSFTSGDECRMRVFGIGF